MELSLIAVLSLVVAFLGYRGYMLTKQAKSLTGAVLSNQSTLDKLTDALVMVNEELTSELVKLKKIQESMALTPPNEMQKELEEGLEEINKKVAEAFNQEYMSNLEDRGL